MMSATNRVIAPERLPLDQSQTLFSVYENKGWSVKQQVTTFVTWLTPVVVSLIGLSLSQYGRAEGLANLASLTAFASSVFMAGIVWGSLRHADRDYERADAALEEGKHLFPERVLKAIQLKRKPAFDWLNDHTGKRLSQGTLDLLNRRIRLGMM